MARGHVYKQNTAPDSYGNKWDGILPSILVLCPYGVPDANPVRFPSPPFCHFGFSKILRCTEVMKSTTSRSSKTHTVHKSHIILVRPLDFVALHSYYGLLFWLFTLTLN